METFLVNIYGGISMAENRNPYTTEGHEKLQRAEHQIKAAIGFPESKNFSKEEPKTSSRY